MKGARHAGREGFTLAEVAVTIVIVGVALVALLQGINTAKMTAAHTRNLKLSSELARLTLGRVASGLFRDDLDVGVFLDGTYADEGYPEFIWELVLGDEEFPDHEDDEEVEYRDRYDSFSWNDDEDEEDDEVEEPYETVKVRVIFPAMREFSNELVLERWIPWKQVYGEDEE